MGFKPDRRTSPEANDRTASRKELARQLRRQAYQKSKEARATDPKHLARKEAAKLARRELYQKAKAQRKASASEQKVKSKIERKVVQTAERTRADQELAQLVTWGTQKKTPFDVN